MTESTINPEWIAADLELRFVNSDGSYFDVDHPVRFRKEDMAQVQAALAENDRATLDRLAVRKFALV